MAQKPGLKLGQPIRYGDGARESRVESRESRVERRKTKDERRETREERGTKRRGDWKNGRGVDQQQACPRSTRRKPAELEGRPPAEGVLQQTTPMAYATQTKTSRRKSMSPEQFRLSQTHPAEPPLEKALQNLGSKIEGHESGGPVAGFPAFLADRSESSKSSPAKNKLGFMYAGRSPRPGLARHIHYEPQTLPRAYNS
jgi:hypothetical protein